LFTAFIGLILWLYFTPEDVSCVYAQRGLTCPTCGLTRGFRAIITFDSTAVINPLQLKIIVFVLIQFFLRFLLTLRSFYKTPSQKLITIDIAMSALMFVMAFYELFPFVN